MVDNCPVCGSDRVTNYTLYQKRNKGSNDGCLGCLLLLLIAIIAPGLVLVVGAVVGITIAALDIPIFIAIILGLIVAIVVKIYQQGLFICEKCGHKFK